jgi:hypothetical protein
VGFRLEEQARVFGGGTWTLTDAAVGAGACHIGSFPPRVPPDVQRQAYGTFLQAVAGAAERMRSQPGSLPLVLVGGGSVLLPERLGTFGEVLRPRHYDVANAIGAALAEVSGHSDRVYALAGRTREALLAEAVAAAEADAVRAGADPDGLELREVEELPIAYLPADSLRIRAVVTGRLKGANP